MALQIGQQLGSYEITSLLGKGGMGEVYRARDSKLKREVAIKVLPNEFSQDTERLNRFQREAEIVAALNHPNVGTIYDIQEQNGTRFLVLELVEGETLADRIKSGPIPINESLQIAKQICEALEAGHEKGIIHRDLKPANVKITPDGKVKVLDFGLAKVFENTPSGVALSNSPTLSIATTQQGVILGTAAYMSPEQAKAKPADKRSDVWAFGCVLFEMLTGKQAFRGEDVTEILASVLKTEPEWALLPGETPANIRFVLRRCLEKDPKRRFHSAADVQIQMEETMAIVSVPTAATSAFVGSRSWKRALAWSLVGLAACAVTGVVVWKLRPSPAPPAVARFTVMPPPTHSLVLPLPGGCPTIALSPDGNRLAYVTTSNGNQQLYLRSMDNLESKPVSGGNGNEVRTPVFSPDGEWLSFGAEGKLRKIPTGGGAPVTVASFPNCQAGATWSARDDIIVARQAGLLRVPATGGVAPESFITPELQKGERNVLSPEFLPGDKALLFTVTPATGLPPLDQAQIVVRKLDTSEQSVLVQGGTSPHYAATGHLVFARAGTIMAVPFDLKRLQVTGGPVALVEGLARTADGFSQFSISRNGSLAYLTGGPQQDQNLTLVWVDRKGVAQPLGVPPRQYTFPQLSPDGRQLALVIESPKNDVWIYDLPRGTLTRLTFEGNNNSRPLWTPDGKRILFRSNKAGPAFNLFWKLADGTGPEEQIENLTMNLPSSITPDGKLAFFYATDSKTRQDLWMVPLEGERKPAVLLQTPFNEVAAKISPDGALLAYQSNESGRDEIYARSFPGPGGKWQISTQGGTEPLWSRNGRELFYRNDDKLMAVDIAPGPAFKARSPHLLFEGKYATRPGVTETNYDVSPDGQRFLMVKAGEQSEAVTQLHVVLNWFEELKRRVPVR